ncbi:MAG: NYN domain-containing protein [Gemmataceae bacterium]
MFLIDGYNLLHAMGALSGRLGPHALERARGRLLGLLHGCYGNEGNQVTVVFDARGAPPGVPGKLEYHGLHIAFAVDQQEADDLIELMIEKESTPKKLTVVSDDHRIQKAARRRQCVVRGCLDYLEDLDRQRRPKRQGPSEAPAKPTGLSLAEAELWLREFADLENDPQTKELFDPFGFQKDEQ